MNEKIADAIEAYEKDCHSYWIVAEQYTEKRPLQLHAFERSIQQVHYAAKRFYVYRKAIQAYFDSIEQLTNKGGEIDPVRYPGGDRIVGGFALAMQLAANVAEEPIYTIADIDGTDKPFTYAFLPEGQAEDYEKRLLQ